MRTPPAPGRPYTRRLVLGAGLAVAATGLVAACGSDEDDPIPGGPPGAANAEPAEPTVPTPAGTAQMFSGTFTSAKMKGRRTRWAVSRPQGVTGTLPVVLALHGLNSNERAAFQGGLEMQQYMQELVEKGNAPFALAGVDVGNSYYHPRADGTDSGAMILDEFLPMLKANRELNVSTDRIAFLGWSMGGYGALRLGGMLGAPRVAAIAVSSPALWADPVNFPPRAFDSAEAYQQFSLFGTQGTMFARIPLLIEIGSNDQFYNATRQWMAGLHPPAAFGTQPGGHNNRYWKTVLPDQLMFISRELAR